MNKTENIDLNSDYYQSHLITYIGNKRKLLPFLYEAFSCVKKEAGKDKLIVLDGFAGGGSVSRLLKTIAAELHVNDLEGYVKTVNTAYLSNRSDVNIELLDGYIAWLNEHKLDSSEIGFIEQHYAPRDDTNIKAGERVFYTNKNAKIIDNIRRLIEKIPEPYKTLCLAALIVKASIHTNTSGVFKGFHKKNGIGHFGGAGENALSRIMREIILEAPIFSDFECPVFVYKKDINELVRDASLPRFDLAYYDPPYNQHPYGSNYFMLNIINEGRAVEIQNGVSGISKKWNRSAYNKQKQAEISISDLIENTRADFIAISYNDEGIIPLDKFKKILSQHGDWELFSQDYNTYKGSRNLRNRNLKVKELLWVLKTTKKHGKENE